MDFDCLVNIIGICGIDRLMISIIRYMSAKRRLKESFKTLEAMSDTSVPFLLAQHDMIQCEVQFYKERATIFCVVFAVIAISLLGAWYGFFN